jgi:hypothetical protein
MSQAPPPRRRWLQFGMGTMFVVVTAFAVWLGWELKFIRDRKNFLVLLDEYRADHWRDQPRAASISSWFQIPAHEEAGIHFWRRWLGDEAQSVILLPGNTSETHLRQARSLFPEAKYFAQNGVTIPNE